MTTTSTRSLDLHLDLTAPWCVALLDDPSVTVLGSDIARDADGEPVSNSLFNRTLCHPTGIRAHVLFRRTARVSPTSSPSSTTATTSRSNNSGTTTPRTEHCYLLSLGSDLDGRVGRAHGGLNAVLLDAVCGAAANYAARTPMAGAGVALAGPHDTPPVTGSLTVDFRAPLATPGVIFVRGWVREIQGRKIWVEGSIADAHGTECATGRGLFVAARAAEEKARRNKAAL